MDLFAPVSLGDLQLANRVVMAPLTRLRAGDAGVPGELVADHYAQRASVGLIITEGTFPNPESRAYAGQPGIVTDEQVEGWRRVAEAVHARGGRIVMQLMHGGRVSHPLINGADRLLRWYIEDVWGYFDADHTPFSEHLKFDGRRACVNDRVKVHVWSP